MGKERLFEKVISTGNKLFGAGKPDPKEVAGKSAVTFLRVAVGSITSVLKLFYYKNRIERKGWQKDFSEYAMKNHPDFVKSWGDKL